MISTMLAVPTLMLATAPYNWTWWSGSPYPAHVTWPPVKGVYMEFLNVGSRYGSAMFVDDQTGCAFIFGGVTYGKNGSLGGETKEFGFTNDLWRLNFSRDATSAWTWVHGSDQFEHIGNYTAIDDTNPFVFPGARAYSMHFYDGDLRKFYLFNGNGYANGEWWGNTGDHWSYNVDTNCFTWIGGILNLYASPSFVLQEESLSTSIGGIYNAAFAYDSISKLFYIYGGTIGDDIIVSTLWRYRVANNMFTALTDSGEYSLSSIVTNGTLNPENKPGARIKASMIVTDKGKLYLFGGYGRFPMRDSETMAYDDGSETWMFDLTENMWAFVAGSPYAMDDGNYVQGSLNQYPSRRSYSNFIYDFLNNRGLLQGGENYDQGVNQTICSDEWLFNVENHTWSLVSGESCSYRAPVYGEYRVPSSENSPGSRAGAASFSQNGLAYVFGGSFAAELWRVEFAKPALSMVTTTTTSTTSEILSTQETTVLTSSSELTTATMVTAEISTMQRPLNITIWFNTSTLLDTLESSTSSSSNARSTGTTSQAAAKPNPFRSETFMDPSFLIYAAIGIALFTLMVLLVFSVWFLKCRKRKSNYSKSTLPLSTTSRLYSGLSTTSQLNSTTQVTSTLVTLTQDILSIPAYLEVPESSFRITTKLSQGGGGEVFLADALDDKTRKFGDLLVVKRIRSNNPSQDLTPKQVKLFEQELSVMALLRGNKNISKLVGYCRIGSHCILMKYYHMGSLDKFLQNRENMITKSVIVHFVSDIACGIKTLHQNELSHSDIKTANILLDVDEDGFVFCVLTDFGITQILSLDHVIDGFNVTNIKGLSYAYASPETFERQKSRSRFNDNALSFKAGDIYSFGSVIYEIISRRYPWS